MSKCEDSDKSKAAVTDKPHNISDVVEQVLWGFSFISGDIVSYLGM
jgi:hypothetical protein